MNGLINLCWSPLHGFQCLWVPRGCKQVCILCWHWKYPAPVIPVLEADALIHFILIWKKTLKQLLCLHSPSCVLSLPIYLYVFSASLRGPINSWENYSQDFLQLSSTFPCLFCVLLDVVAIDPHVPTCPIARSCTGDCDIHPAGRHACVK